MVNIVIFNKNDKLHYICISKFNSLIDMLTILIIHDIW